MDQQLNQDVIDYLHSLFANQARSVGGGERSEGMDDISINKMIVREIPKNPKVKDWVGWDVNWVIDKRPVDVVTWAEARMPISISVPNIELPSTIRNASERNVFLLNNSPEYKKAYNELRQEFETKPFIDERVLAYGNLLVNAGMDFIWDTVMGTSVTAFSNANAYIGVGDSSTAAATSQTDLQASSNKLRKAMNASFPDQPTNPSIRFQSDFTGSEANYAWLEVATFNASSSGIMLHRLVPGGGLGTKSSGATWTITVTITLS